MNPVITHDPLSTRWDHHFYGPVAAVRPYLIVKCVLTLLAFDAWIAMLPFAAFYGTVDLNVSHFSWLTTLQPRLSPGWHLFFLFVVGWLSVFLIVRGSSRWLMLILGLAYTYVWAMSRMDSYTHHYLLSILLLSFTLFPDLPSTRRELRRTVPSGTCVSAWAYVLLVATAGVIFFYCAMAKVDGPWRSGATLLAMEGPERLYGPIQTWLERYGLQREQFWWLISHAVIFLELILAVAYVFSIDQDRASSRWLRLAMWGAWSLAMVLHVGNEFLDLSIRWFSFYMMLLGCMAFLPAAWLEYVAAPYRWLDGQQTRWMEYGLFSSSLRVRGAPFASAGVSFVAAGWCLDLPGAWAACLTILAAMAVPWFFLRGKRREELVMSYTLPALLATAAMVVTVTVTSSRGEFYRHRGDELLLVDAPKAALTAYAQAERYLPRRSHHLPEILNNTGSAYEQLQELDQAEVAYRTAIAQAETATSYETPRINLARLLTAQARRERDTEQYHAAIDRYREALTMHADVETRYEFANLLLRLRQTAEAVVEYRQCARELPESVEILANLGATLVMQGDIDEALRTLRSAVAKQPDYVPASTNLAQALRQNNEIDAAVGVYEALLDHHPGDGALRGEFAGLLLASQQTDRAVSEFQRAVRDLPDDASLRCNFGAALARVGRVEDAVAELRFALVLNPNDTTAKNNLRLLEKPPSSP